VPSILDPLPRSFSTRSLVILVAMLVTGVGISVHEYLESGKATRKTAQEAARAVPEPGTARTPARAPGISAEATLRPTEAAPIIPPPTCVRPVETGSWSNPSPGVWIPDSQYDGS
jgi:hypothetical protein